MPFCLRLLFSVFCFSAPILANAQQSLPEKELEQIMSARKAIGLATVVVKEGRIIYTHSFGYKNRENNEMLRDSDIFRIASISKSFSATSIMQLVAQKKLSLDDDVSDLIGFKIRNPAFPETVITLKMLLSHRSSLNDSQGYFQLDTINPSTNPDFAKCYSSYRPGTQYRYCNLNFNIVGTIIERVSGERFDQYVKRHVLAPLHLYGGYCVDSLDAKRFTTLYEYDAKADTFTAAPLAYAPRREELSRYKMGYSTPIFSPTGGMKISATDLAKYMIMHMNYGISGGVRIMEKKLSKKMQKPQSETDGYGMAIMNYDDLVPGHKLTGHTGSAYGLYSAMFFDRRKKYGFVVITNGCDGTYTGEVNNLLRETIASLYKNFIKD
ncbi:MAG: beta-lactamase family protein [Mucilaginibacter polytrichastri]|nr:beta-lactamase family protein [Mucilaginibacter polytrichastri]